MHKLLILTTSKLMITDEQKYRSEINKISGFALMTPLGRIFIDPFTVFGESSLGILLGYSLICCLLFVSGAIFVARGHAIVDKKEN